MSLWFALFGLALVAILSLSIILMLLNGNTDGVPLGLFERLLEGLVPVSLIVLPLAMLAALSLFVLDMPVNRRLLWLMVGLAMGIGRRAGCHTICWMAPFMILGRKLRNAVNWPALHLRAQTNKCINCKKCTQNCPMSLDVNSMVQENAMEHSECVLCGSCVDTCPKDVIHYTFSAEK